MTGATPESMALKGMIRIKKRINISNARPGMVLAADLLSDTGRIILSKGTRLTDSMFRSLQIWHVSHLMVEHEETLPDHFQTDKCEKYYDDTLQLIQNSFLTMRLCGELPLVEMQDLALNSILSITETVGALQYLHSMHRSCDYTFHHSVNVSILCGILGRWLGYGGADLQELVLTGLLHDVGKSQVPDNLLKKPGRLTSAEMEQIKTHSFQGTELLKKAGILSSAVIDGVLQHHERMDGSGYPHGIRGNLIHPYARIVAVADMYDAMTSERPYQQKQSPFIVANSIAQEMFGKLDMATSTTFLEHMRDHFIGSQVSLTDGRQAEVVLLGGDFTFKPIIRTQSGEFLDMSRNPAIQIKEVVTA